MAAKNSSIAFTFSLLRLQKFPLNSDFCFFLLDIRFESTMSFQHDQIPSKQAAKAYYDKPGKLASIVASARAGKH